MKQISRDLWETVGEGKLETKRVSVDWEDSGRVVTLLHDALSLPATRRPLVVPVAGPPHDPHTYQTHSTSDAVRRPDACPHGARPSLFEWHLFPKSEISVLPSFTQPLSHVPLTTYVFPLDRSNHTMAVNDLAEMCTVFGLSCQRYLLVSAACPRLFQSFPE